MHTHNTPFDLETVPPLSPEEEAEWREKTHTINTYHVGEFRGTFVLELNCPPLLLAAIPRCFCSTTGKHIRFENAVLHYCGGKHLTITVDGSTLSIPTDEVIRISDETGLVAMPVTPE